MGSDSSLSVGGASILVETRPPIDEDLALAAK